MAREFLGEGWGFPVRTTADGAIRTASGPADIEQSIRIILGTAPGERVMRPEFGCGIHDFVFETVDATTLTLVEDSVREALRDHEPRIDVTSVETSTGDVEAGELSIEIGYRVRETNNEYNLVYPFYLEEG